MRRLTLLGSFLLSLLWFAPALTVEAQLINSYRVGVYDTDAQTYFAAVEAEGGVIDPQVKAGYNTLVVTLKSLTNSSTAASEWASIQEMWLPIHNDNASLNPALVKAKYPGGKNATLTNTNFVAGDYTKAGGLDGNAAGTKRVVTDMIGDDLDFDNFSVVFAFDNLVVDAATNGKLYAAGNTSFQTQWASASLRTTTYAHSGLSNQIIDTYPSNAGIMIVNSTAANSMIEYNDGIQKFSATGTRAAWSITNTIRFFYDGSTNYWSGSMWCYAFGTKFDPANIAAINNAFENLFTLLGRTYKNVVFVGDSITFGTGTTTGSFTVRSILNAAGRYTQINIGQAGLSSITLDSEKVTRFDGKVTSGCVVHLLIGINDLLNSNTAASTFTHIVNIVQYAQSLGASAVLVGTVPVSADLAAGEETERNTLNTTIRNSAATYNYQVVDFAADADLNTWSGTYFNDNTHPNNTGAARMGTISGPVIQLNSVYEPENKIIQLWNNEVLKEAA
jgi:lysophospholipase L1-like esterase